MKRYKQYLLFWLINVLLLYVFSLIFPSSVTLGNSIFKPYQALVFSGFIWNMALWVYEAAIKDLEIPQDNSTVMMLGYLFVNFATLWLIARFAFITGIGVSSFVYISILAVVANFIQYYTWSWMDKKSKK